MDYEKKYKDALERAKELCDVADTFTVTIHDIITIFPELKESKDDRIVRCLLNYFNHVRYNGLDLKGTDVDEVITWLEKQGKRLGADEVTKHQWISVEDELPEVCVAVLTTTPHGTQRVGFYEDGWWLANTPDLVRMGSITHWMPLPSVEHLKDK